MRGREEEGERKVRGRGDERKGRGRGEEGERKVRGK